MVSSVLAQAILEDNSPDIIGAFERGQQKVRGEKSRELVGQAIATGKIDPLLAELNPEVALSIGESIRARNAKDISDFLRDAQIAKSKLDSGNIQGALQFSIQRRNAIRNRGGDTTQTDDFINILQQNPEMAREQLAGLLGAVDQGKTARIQERDRLLSDLKSEDPKVRKSAEIALKLASPAKSGMSADEQVSLAERKARVRADVELETAGEIEKLKASEKAAGKGISERNQRFIDSGVDAADSVANIKRSISLLDEVKTGGFASVSLKAKQLFGVESADEGELSGNLGVAVLSQLKPIFGAAFTVGEVERLESISAGFGKNASTNKRLLKETLRIAERAANRAIRAAERSGDDFTVNEIKMALKEISGADISADSGSKASQGSSGSAPSESSSTPSQQKQGGQIMIDASGNRAMVYPDGTFEELP